MKIPKTSYKLAIRCIALIAVIVMMTAGDLWGCTSALVGINRGEGGRWLLWKHRDSGQKDNYVRNFEATDSTLAYVGLFNASDTDAHEVWIGFNSAGFAVMNTASYNIPSPDDDCKDREGLIMTEALRSCRSLDDFYRLLTDYPGRRGVQANFGAFDATGNGAYFETSDRGVTVYPVDSTGIATRTNYSLSGGERGRLGVSRHRAETHLLDSIMSTPREWGALGQLAAEDLIETLSRSLYLPSACIDLLDGKATRYPDNGDVISRRSSCASVVIEGSLPGENPAETMIMWTAIGFPTLSVVQPVTLDSVPEVLFPTGPEGHSTLCDSVNILRDRAFLPAKQSAKRGSSKHRYDFDLKYLRREIPRRRQLSLPRYAPARESVRRSR